MALIKTIDAGLYWIPLTVSLSDSTHGKINAFELVICHVRDSDGAEGVGYTYTVGRNGGSIADALRREIPELIDGREADDTEAIWHHVGWALHYGGRGGPPVLALSALDIALWDLKARRANVPLFRRRSRTLLRRRHRPRSLRGRAFAANGRQSRQGLSRHQDEGRLTRSRIRCQARGGDA
jgi:L-alanine-DL-glutamate epimerase-like enolase superfamily enzyme